MLSNNKKAAIIPSGINPAAVMKGAGAIGGAAARAVPQMGSGLLGGLGFGIGGKVTDLVSRSAMGIKPLLIAIAFDTFAYFTGEVNPVFGIFFHIVVAWILLSKYLPGDKPLRILLWSKIFVLIYVLVLGFFPAILNILPELHRWIFLTVGNHAFPIATMYVVFTGFISNRTGGIIVQIIYFAAFFSLIFFAYDQAQDEIDDLFSKAGIDIKSTMPAGQKTVFATFVQDLIHSTKTTGGSFVKALRNSPQAIANFVDPKISAAGGESLFGKEKEEQPKIGLVITPHPGGAKMQGDEKRVIKAYLSLPYPPPDRHFVTVTKMRCYHENSRTNAQVDGEIVEYPPEVLQKGVNIFYGKENTISCKFNEEDLTGVSNVKLAVGYDSSSNAKLKTYIMKEDVLDAKLIRKENPLLGIPDSAKHPTTKYDNGPAKFGIGPIDLTNPPFGIIDNKIYPDFEFLIGNNPEFNGHISEVNNIILTLPDGFSLGNPDDSKACRFSLDQNGKYSLNEEAIKQKATDFTNIKTSRFFTCMLKIDAKKALGDAYYTSPDDPRPAYVEVEFNADVDFNYETEAELSTKIRS